MYAHCPIILPLLREHSLSRKISLVHGKVHPTFEPSSESFTFCFMSEKISGTTVCVSSFLDIIGYQGSQICESSRKLSFSTNKYGLMSTAIIIPIRTSDCLRLYAVFLQGRVTCERLLEVRLSGLGTRWCSTDFQMRHKGAFPHDVAFEVELPRLTTCQHFLHIGFEPSSGFLIK